jgi:hypothetical protein
MPRDHRESCERRSQFDGGVEGSESQGCKSEYSSLRSWPIGQHRKRSRAD